MRRSPFMLVRLASPDVAAGSITCAQAADLGRHDVHVHDEQAALADGVHDRLDLRLPIAAGHRVHGGLHQVGAPLVDALELGAFSVVLKWSQPQM